LAGFDDDATFQNIKQAEAAQQKAAPLEPSFQRLTPAKRCFSPVHLESRTHDQLMLLFAQISLTLQYFEQQICDICDVG
jgi:hypothetical protein